MNKIKEDFKNKCVNKQSCIFSIISYVNTTNKSDMPACDLDHLMSRVYIQHECKIDN